MNSQELWHYLSQRKNFGCHPELGKRARLIRFGRAVRAGKAIYRVGAKADDETLFAEISADELRSRGLSRHSEVVKLGMPVFVLQGKTRWRHMGCLFLNKPEEVLLMLRVNLAFLRKRNDLESERLSRELTGLSASELPAPEDVCRALVDLRKSSSEAFLEVLESSASRRLAVESSDRGELLGVMDRCGEMSQQLQDEDVKLLIRSVRAHYLARLQDLLKNGVSLSALGRKIFKENDLAEYGAGDRQALLLLALSVATGRGRVGKLYTGGKFLINNRQSPL